MELYYCDACGLRIKSGDGQVGADAQRYCDGCFAKKFPGVAAPASATIRTTTPSPGAYKSGAVLSSPNDSSSRRKPSKQEPTRSPKSSANTTMIAAGGGGVAALLVVGFLLMGGKSEPPPVAMKEAPRPEKLDKLDKTEKATNAAPVAKSPPAPLPQASTPQTVAEPNAPRNRAADAPARGNSPVAADAGKSETGRAGGGGLFAPDALRANSQDDYRENYARRRMTELLEVEQKGSMKPAEFRKRVNELAAGYSNTAAGKEAAEKLKSLDANAPVAATGAAEKQKSGAGKAETEQMTPADQARLLLGEAAPASAAPPAAAASEPTQILYKNSFDTDEEWKLVDGTRETATQNGTGAAVKSTPQSPGYFVAKIHFKFGQAPVKLGSNSWMKITYKTQGTADICFHTAVSGAVYEKFFFGIKPGKWQTLVLHFNQFGKCISRGNDSQPPPNSDLQGVTMFLGSNTGAGASAVVDDIVIGDGAVPKD